MYPAHTLFHIPKLLKNLQGCRLCKQVTGAVFFAILVVEAVILFFSVHNYERDRLAEIEREGMSVVRAWLEISGDDDLTLNKMAPMIGEGSVLLSATVYGANGQEVAHLSQNKILSDSQAFFNVQWSSAELHQPFSVLAVLDKSEMDVHIRDYVIRIIGLVLLISFFVTLVAMLILERLMLNPIRAISHRMSNACIDLNHPDMIPIVPLRDDELGDVAIAYNSLIKRLSSAFGEIRTQQASLLENNSKLEDEVSARTKELNRLVHELRREAAERERAEKALDASNSELSSAHLRKLAYTDTLTGLANRDLFIDRCNQILHQMKRSELKAAVHMIDLDSFDDINQTFGSTAGDLVLQTIAERLSSLVRESDTVARLSADEFALVQFDIDDSDDASVLAQRINEVVQHPIEWGADLIRVTCSIGITLLNSNDESVEDILHHVALARLRAKEEPGSSYHFYAEEMNRVALERQAIERDLKRAVPNGELQLYFQPKLDVRQDRVAGMEALIRWNHPERGFMPPDLFIPVAERTALIVEIGNWVLREACRHARAWQLAGLGDLKVAVNVSAVQLRECDMVTQVRQVLLETDLPAHLLELELTESAVMENVEETIVTLQKLRALGISLSIDDFGTGYSSLNYLKRFPVQRVKIDKAFIDEIESPRSEGVIARAVITMGHSFGMEVTAEGVEEQFQLNFLSNLGCDEVQGYFYARPLAAGDFETFVKDQNTSLMAAE